MIGSRPEPQLAELATACSGSAQALRHAIVAVEGQDWQDLLSKAYLERVELFEVCARCLVAEDLSPKEIGGLAAAEPLDGPPGTGQAIEGVVVAERALERAIVMLARRPNGTDARLVALARAQLSGVRGLRRRLAHHRAPAPPDPALPAGGMEPMASGALR
jgi:hypothetical protein